jgi:broad specificity phosphatase PhoE
MDTQKNYSTFYIVRHGETEFNVQKITQGHSDSPLTENGIKQAETLGTMFQDIQFDMVFSSDLLRAQKTAELIVLQKKLLVNTAVLLRERNNGKYEAQPRELLLEENKEIFEKIKSFTNQERRTFKVHPEVETDFEIATRLITFIREAAITYPEKTILVVTHGGIMRAFLNHMDWNGEKDLKPGAILNTGYIKLKSDGTDFVIKDVIGVEKD